MRSFAFGGSALGAGAVLLALAPGPIGALPPPTTADATSLQTSSLLIDDRANFYVFPQLARQLGSGLSSFGAGGSGSRGSGVRAVAGRHGFQYAYLASTPSRVHEQARPPAFQLGWSAVAGDWRAGVAFSWSTRGQKERDGEVTNRDVGTRVFEDSMFQTIDHRGITVGIGWERSGALFDLSLAALREELTHEWHYRSVRVDPPVDPLVETFTLNVDGDLRWRGTTRARVPLGERTALRGYASFEDQRHSVDVQRSRTSASGGQSSGREYRAGATPYGHRWSAGARVEHETGAATAGAFVEFEDSRDAWRYDAGGRSWEQERDRSKAFRAGASLQTPFLWRFQLRSGIQGEFFSLEREFRWNRDENLEAGVFRAGVDIDTGTRFSFAWGLERSFRSFDLTGTLSRTLSAGNLLGLLDAHIHF